MCSAVDPFKRLNTFFGSGLLVLGRPISSLRQKWPQASEMNETSVLGIRTLRGFGDVKSLDCLVVIEPLTVAHSIEPWGRACPGVLLSRGGHEQRRCFTSQGVLVSPRERPITSPTGGTVLPADDMGGWVGYSYLDADALLDRTAVQGTSHRTQKRLENP